MKDPEEQSTTEEGGEPTTLEGRLRRLEAIMVQLEAGGREQDGILVPVEASDLGPGHAGTEQARHHEQDRQRASCQHGETLLHRLCAT